MKLIGLTGKKRSGKSTAALLIRQLYPDISFQDLSFAGLLKQEVSQATGYELEYMEAHKDIFRPIFQWWGTELRRNLAGEDYWVNKVEEILTKSHYDLSVITDVRFHNEADMIRSRDGYIIRLRRYTDDYTDMHPSETELESIKADWYVVNNSDDFVNLKANLKYILDPIVLKSK